MILRRFYTTENVNGILYEVFVYPLFIWKQLQYPSLRQIASLSP